MRSCCIMQEAVDYDGHQLSLRLTETASADETFMRLLADGFNSVCLRHLLHEPVYTQSFVGKMHRLRLPSGLKHTSESVQNARILTRHEDI